MQEQLLQHVVLQQGLTRTISSSTVVLSHADETQPSIMLSDSSDESRATSPSPRQAENYASLNCVSKLIYFTALPAAPGPKQERELPTPSRCCS